VALLIVPVIALVWADKTPKKADLSAPTALVAPLAAPAAAAVAPTATLRN
jgi:hypothetical protein